MEKKNGTEKRKETCFTNISWLVEDRTKAPRVLLFPSSYASMWHYFQKRRILYKALCTRQIWGSMLSGLSCEIQALNGILIGCEVTFGF